jgi:hypothetical protein
MFLLVLLSFSVFAEEIKREITRSIDGEIRTTITYRKESNGMIKKILIGQGPNYTDCIEYFDGTNEEYFAVCNYNNLEYGDPKFPEGKARTGLFLYREGKPTGAIRSEFTRSGEYVESRTFFNTDNKDNLKEEVITTKDTFVVIIKKIFNDGIRNTDNKKEVSYYYYNGNIVRTEINYYDNKNFFHEQIYEYDPPVFSRETNPKRILTVFKNNASGITRRETQYDENAWHINMDYYDPEKTKDRFTRIMSFYEGDILRRKLIYFDDVLLKGQIYFISSWYNDDGSMKSAELYDKNEKKIK